MEEGTTGDIGSRLRHRRIARGLSLDEVSAALRISTAHLSALEFNDASAIPNSTFARGYLKAYCRFVGIQEPDSSPPIANEGQRTKVSMARPLNRQTRATDPMVKGVSAVIVAVTLLATVFWWRSQQNTETADLSVVTTQSIAVDTVDGTVLVSAEDAASSLGPNLNDMKPEETDEDPGGIAPAVAPESPLVSGGVVPTPIVMVAEFSDTSWVEVRNAANEILFTGVKGAGERLQLEGEALLNIVVGNAAGVDLSYNGNKVALAQFTDERNVAKLKLGL